MLRRLGILLAVVGLGVVWWYPVSTYLIVPGTIRVGVVLLGLVLGAAYFHAKAYIRFSGMVNEIRQQEASGEVDEGSTLFAINQRFRYAARVVESMMAIGIGALAIIAAHYPKIATNPNYGKFVITYFLGTVAITGVLTWRDLHVLNIVEKIDNAEAARLVGVGGKHAPR